VSRIPTLLLPLLLLALPLRAQTPEELEAARESLRLAAEATTVAEGRRLAAEALPALLERAGNPEANCYELYLLVEAQIRANLASDALSTERRAAELGCDEADRLQLRAWALEYSPEGVRRGEGAQLRAAEAAYRRAADLLSRRPEQDHARIAGCLGNASELAHARGDHEAAFELARTAIQLAPTPRQREQLGLVVLLAGAPLHGEGTCLDLVGAHVEEQQLVRLTDMRLQQLRKRLDQGHDDATALAAVAFYAVMAGTEYELVNARRYLLEALALDDSLPDAWYLLGRVREQQQRIPEAKQAFREQVAKRPGAAATRLAVNGLAYLEGEILDSPEAGERALALLDAEIEETPLEAAFRDTRARLLLALGRKDEACAAAGAAYKLAGDGDEEFRKGVLRFQRANGCPFGG
jgi:tetratricopeptide (TPR) repeat protein